MKSLTDKQMDILIILSDNRGHAEWDLAEKLDNFSSGLADPLENLKKEIVCGPFFSILDIKDPVNLAAKFRDPEYPVIDYLKAQLTRKTLSHIIPHKVVTDERECLADLLNKLLLVPNLFNSKWFENIELSETTKGTINQNPQGMGLRWLNRILLEIAFSGELETSQKSIIYRGSVRKTTNKKSRHPNQTEFPYYIDQDPNIFKYILNNIYGTLSLIHRYTEEIADLEYERAKEIIAQAKIDLYSDEQVRKLLSDNILNVLHKKHNIFYYFDKEKKLKKLLHVFLVSQYTKNLIKNYGLKFILEIVCKTNALNAEDLDFYSSSLAEMVIKDKNIFKENDIRLAEELISRFSERMKKTFCTSFTAARICT